MAGQEISAAVIWCAAGVVSVILLILLAIVAVFYASVQRALKDLENQQLALGTQLKQLQGTASEVLGEIRRANRLANEQLELKRAEMTGDFEIIEEPILPPNLAQAADINDPGTRPASNGAQAFPKL